MSKKNARILGVITAMLAIGLVLVPAACAMDKNQDLARAVRKGVQEEATRIRIRFAAVNSDDKQGRTALDHTTWGGHPEGMKSSKDRRAPLTFEAPIILARLEGAIRFMKEGAQVKGKTEYVNNSLLRAAFRGDWEALKLLLDRGADVNAGDYHRFTVLMLAARRGRLEVVKLLLDKGADANAQSRFGETALSVAATRGHPEVVRLLLEKGPDGRNRQTALMSAAKEGQLEPVRLLLAKGVDVNASSRVGESALFYAVRGGHAEVAQLLRDEGAKNTLAVPVIEGDVEEVQRLIREGADVNPTDVFDYPLLLRAAKRGSLEVVKVLLDNGAYANVGSRSGNTALMEAAGEGHVKVVKALLDNGADVNTDTVVGKTALMYAAESGHLEAARVLLDRGAEVNAKKDWSGETALMIAKKKGRKEIEDLLRSRGAKE